MQFEQHEKDIDHNEQSESAYEEQSLCDWKKHQNVYFESYE